MLNVQKYLRSGKTFEQLTEEFAIKCKVQDNLVILNYDQIFSPMSHPIVQECRGLILDAKTFDICCFPFRKFFNYGEGHCPVINWTQAKVLEKIDGSNLNLWYNPYKEDFCFSTRKMIYAKGESNSGKTFDQIVHLALNEMQIDWNDLKQKLNKKYTYMFELTSPYSIVYIPYDGNSLTLLAVRDITTLEEVDPKPIAQQLKFPVPKEYSLSQLDDIVSMVNSWKGSEQEGVVVVDNKYNRIKVKNQAYVSGQAIVFSVNASPRNLARLVLMDQSDDVLGSCSQSVKDDINAFKTKLSKLVTTIEKEYVKYESINDMKQFALAIKDNPYKSLFFAKKRQQIDDFRTYIKNLAFSKTSVDFAINLVEQFKE